MLTASNIHYEISDKTRGIAAGGIGLMHRLARRLGLPEAIDRDLHLLKLHLPYHESDHVLNLAYNALAGGECLEDLELLRNDENYLDALGASRIPDPTTAGDFCRRFTEADLRTLLEIQNQTREKVWAEQPPEFFERATIDMDGVLVGTTGECKEGMDISYKGTWGYHPLVVSLAETKEVLALVNRSGNRPSHEGAEAEADQAIALIGATARRLTSTAGTPSPMSALFSAWMSRRHGRWTPTTFPRIPGNRWNAPNAIG